jgi:hypothetical protein
MICKQTQNTIDTLLRLKDSSDNNNKIASIMSKPDSQRTKEEKEDLCVHVLNQLMDKNKNKIASVTPTSKIGEVAEFQSLLRGLNLTV